MKWTNYGDIGKHVIAYIDDCLVIPQYLTYAINEDVATLFSCLSIAVAFVTSFSEVQALVPRASNKLGD